MEIIRGYEELFDIPIKQKSFHPIEKVIERLVVKRIILRDAAQRFLLEIR